MNFEKEFEEILNALQTHKVNYMLVGGYAVNFHGYERTTSDLDIWIKPTKDNLEKVLSVLADLGFDKDSITQIGSFEIEKPFIFQIGSKPYDIEVFNFVTGVRYDDAEPHKIPFKYSSEVTVYFISIRDLILNKMLTGRTKDKLDVEMLQKILRL